MNFQNVANNSFNNNSSNNRTQNQNSRSNISNTISSADPPEVTGGLEVKLVNIRSCAHGSETFTNVLIRYPTADFIILTEFNWGGKKKMYSEDEKVIKIKDSAILLHAPGVGIIFQNRGFALFKGLEQSKKLEEHIYVKERFVLVELRDIVVGGVYFPTTQATKSQFDKFYESLSQSIAWSRKRRSSRWKTLFIGADFNAHVTRLPGVIGDHLHFQNVKDNDAGKRLTTFLQEKSLCMGSSFLKTYSCRKTFLNIEMDGFICETKDVWRFRKLNFERIPRLDHAAVMFEVTPRSFVEIAFPKNSPKKWKYIATPDTAACRPFKEKLRMTRNLEEFQEVFSDAKKTFLQDVPPGTAQDEQRAHVHVIKNEGVQTNGVHPETWQWLKANSRPNVCGISDETARNVFSTVGNSPSAMQIPDAMFSSIPKVAETSVSKMDEPFSEDELNRALRKLPKEGAFDANKLQAAVFNYLGMDERRHFLSIVNDEFERKNGDWGAEVNKCKCAKLHKKGDIHDGLNYRYLVVSGVLVKVIMKMVEGRLSWLLEEEKLAPPEQFGFQKNKGCLDAILMMSRIREDMEKYRKVEEFCRPVLSMLDLYKAFPSLNWFLTTRVFEALGLGETKLWHMLQKGHRAATYHFGRVHCTQSHGLKEGCPTSPVTFIIVFSAVWAMHVREMDLKPRMTRGLTLRCLPSEVPRNRVDQIAKLIYPSEDNNIQETMVAASAFADDLNPIEQILPETAESVWNGGSEIFATLTAAPNILRLLTDGGLRENVDKRKVEFLIDTKEKNLGVLIDNGADTKRKIAIAWAKFHSLQKNLIGLGGLNRRDRGLLIMAFCRSVLLYGVQSRGLLDEELKILRQAEYRMVSILLEMPNHLKKAFKKKMCDLYMELCLPPLGGNIMYLKAKFFGHIMRRDNGYLPKLALLGRFFPERVDETDAGKRRFFTDGDVAISRQEKAAKKNTEGEQTVLGNVVSWLVRKAHIPACCIHEFASCASPEGKSRYYKVTREAFVADTLDFYKRGHSATEEKMSDLQEKMCKRDGLDPGLETWKAIFQNDKCFACGMTVNPGGLEEHFKRWHRTCTATEESQAEHNKFVTESKQDFKAVLSDFREKWGEYCEPRTVNTEGGTRQTKYYCKICEVAYTTRDIEAMELHCANHAADQPSKIGKAKDGRDVYWPEENYFSRALGRRTHGTQAHLWKIIIPSSMRALGEDRICCRKCINKSWKFKDDEPVRTLANRLKHWEKHESICRGVENR